MKEITKSLINILNEGGMRFYTSAIDTNAKDAYVECRNSDRIEHNNDPYSGTISSSDDWDEVVTKISDVYSEDLDKAAEEIANMDHDFVGNETKCLDLGEIPGKPNLHKYVFYGWARY